MASADPSDRGVSLADLNVHACFESHKKGDSVDYRKLVTQLERLKDDPPATLLSTLAQSTQDIDEARHGDLLRAIFNLSPWTCRQETSTCLGELILSLVSANGRLLHSSLDWLVSNFLPPALRPFVHSINSDAKELQWSRRDAVLSHVHQVLERLTDMVPTAPIHLLPILLIRMPHRRMDERVLVLYLDNLFRLAAQKRTGAVVRNQLLVAVVDYLIQFDVEISWEDILRLEESRRAEQEATRVQAESLPTADDKAGVVKWAEEKSSDKMAQKLDSLMDATFAHLRQRIESGQLEEVHDTLMTSFCTTILHASRSKFTQFLIFYTCSQDNVRFGGSFLSHVMSIIISTSEPPKTRVSAAAYLASFCARAKFMKLNAVCAVLQSLSKWLMGQLCDWEVERHSKPGDDHTVFHAGLQALLYVLCYRMVWMQADPYARSVLRSFPLQQLLQHSSLQVLVPSVLEEFVFQAAEMDVLDERAVEGIRRVSQAGPSSMSSSSSRVTDLDMFFPFDPYLLKTSARFLEDLYIDWPQVQEACSSYKPDSVDAEQPSREREASPDCSPMLESMTLSDIPAMDLHRESTPLHSHSAYEDTDSAKASWQEEIETFDAKQFNGKPTFIFDIPNFSTPASQYPLLSLPASLPTG